MHAQQHHLQGNLFVRVTTRIALGTRLCHSQYLQGTGRGEISALQLNDNADLTKHFFIMSQYLLPQTQEFRDCPPGFLYILALSTVIKEVQEDGAVLSKRQYQEGEYDTG